ncbi:MAG: dephospho-CoA kinase [Bacteroidaceae bacterium]|nr:dephospho-CoA kinase [Bacteroidaceae bacterium]
MAIKIGITGGIGSGKSVVSALLRIMGIPVYDSDTEAKRLMDTNPDIRSFLIKTVGKNVYHDGHLNRSLLGSYIFGNADHIQQVNQVIHPIVKEDFRKWVDSRQSEKGIVGIESAILFEAGFGREVDYMIMVDSPLILREERIEIRDSAHEGFSHEQIKKRIQNQMSNEDKCKLSDFIINNNEDSPLIPQILELISLLLKKND